MLPKEVFVTLVLERTTYPSRQVRQRVLDPPDKITAGAMAADALSDWLHGGWRVARVVSIEGMEDAD